MHLLMNILTITALVSGAASLTCHSCYYVDTSVDYDNDTLRAEAESMVRQNMPGDRMCLQLGSYFRPAAAARETCQDNSTHVARCVWFQTINYGSIASLPYGPANVTVHGVSRNCFAVPKAEATDKGCTSTIPSYYGPNIAALRGPITYTSYSGQICWCNTDRCNTDRSPLPREGPCSSAGRHLAVLSSILAAFVSTMV